MKKKIAIVVGTLAVLAVIAVAAYAAYNIDGSSSAQGFTSGQAADLAVDPTEVDLNGILPGETRWMNILITNNNPVPATVTSLTATFNDGGVCAFTVTNSPNPPYGIAANTSVWDGVWVAMGNAAQNCENNNTLTVTATATGTLP